MTHSSDDLDRMINEALDAEDREIFGELGEEPGYFAQAIGLFRGKLAWVMWVIYITNCLLYTSPSPRDLSTSRMPSSA